MSILDIPKNVWDSSYRSVKKLAVLNPLTIRQKSTRAKAFFALALVCFFWGTTWIATKQAVKGMPALQMVGLRQTIAGFCFILFYIVKKEPWPTLKEWRGILILTVLNFLLSNALSAWGVKYIPAGLASIIAATLPLWLVIIGRLRGEKRLPLMAYIGVIIGLGGICIIFSQHVKGFLNPEFRMGIIISFTAVWTWAIGTLYTKKHAVQFNPYFSIGLQMFIGGGILLIMSYLFPAGSMKALPLQHIPLRSWLGIAYLIIFGSFIAFIAYLYALQHLPTQQASMYSYVNPIVALLFSALLFNETLTAYIIIGGIVTLLGVYVVNKSTKKG